MKTSTILISLIIFHIFASLTYSQQINWIPYNQGLEGGLFRKILTNGNVIIASNGRSIFKTVDGEFWTEINEDFNPVDIAVENERIYILDHYKIIYSDDNLNTFETINLNFWSDYIATGDSKIFCLDYWNRELFFSSNYGISWEKSIAPTSGNLIYNDGILFIQGNDGLYYSNDNGKNFYEIKFNNEAIHSSNISGKYIYHLRYGEVNYTTNLGKTWSKFDNKKITGENNSTYLTYFAANKNILIASFDDYSNYNYSTNFSISTNLGQTWKVGKLENSLSVTNVFSFKQGIFVTITDIFSFLGYFAKYDGMNNKWISKNNGLYLRELFNASTDGNNFFITDTYSNLYVLKNNSNKWEKIIDDAFNHFIDSSGIYIFKFTENKILKSTNLGKNFIEITVDFNTSEYSSNSKPVKFNHKFLVSFKDTIFTFDENGKNYLKFMNGIINNGKNIYLYGGKNSIFAVQNDKIYKLDKKQNIWQDITNKFEGFDNYIKIFEIDNFTFFVVNEKGIYLSKDDENNIQKISDISYHITSLDKIGDFLIATTSSNYFLISKNFGKTFNELEFVLNGKNLGYFSKYFFDKVISTENKTLLKSSDKIFITNDKPKAPPIDWVGRRQDSLALVSLFNLTNGLNWYRKDNWLTNLPLDLWYGIYLNDNGRVYSINLNNNNLRGIVPTELGNLSKLQYLILSDNNIVGVIPKEFEKLTQLKYLSFTRNNLNGNIADIIKILTKVDSLEILALGKNSLEGTLPTEIGNFKMIKELYLWGNKFTGTIPKEIGNLKQLQVIDLGYNSFSGEIPKEFEKLTQLYYISFTRCNLNGNISNLIKEITKLNNLVILGLGGNNFDGEIPTEIGRLIKLIGLYLWGNKLTGNIPREIGNLTNLEVFDIGDNQLSGNIPREIGNLTNLEDFDVGDNQLSGEIPKEVEKLKKLKYFRVTRNNLSGNIPKELTNLDSLETLLLFGNKFDGVIPYEIGNLKNLKYLYLGSNQLIGNIPKEIGELKNLILLDLSGNQLEGEIPFEFQKLSNLTQLYIHNNKLSGGLENIKAYSLDSLYIFGNKFDFEDFLKNPNLKAKSFKYHPQDSLGLETQIALNEGEKLFIVIDSSEVPGNKYKWYYNGNYLTNQSTRELIIENIRKEFEGLYTCEVTNPIAPELTLYLRPIHVIVNNTSTVENRICDSITKTSTILVTPNPFDDIVSIKVNEDLTNFKFVIQDSKGNIMLSGRVPSTNFSIDLRNLPRGLYSLILQGQNKNKIFKKVLIKY